MTDVLVESATPFPPPARRFGSLPMLVFLEGLFEAYKTRQEFSTITCHKESNVISRYAPILAISD